MAKKLTHEDNEATASRLQDKREKISQLEVEQRSQLEQVDIEVTAEQLASEEALLDARIDALQATSGITQVRKGAPDLAAAKEAMTAAVNDGKDA